MEIDHEKDVWDELALSCCSYNSQIDKDFIDVMKGIRDKKYCTKIAEELGLPEQYVELIQSILASKDILEYGTSPRGAWFNVDADEYIKKWEEQYKQWGKE